MNKRFCRTLALVSFTLLLLLPCSAVAQTETVGFWDIAGVWYDRDASDGSGSMTVFTRTGLGQYIAEVHHAGPPILQSLNEDKRTVHVGPVIRTGLNEWKFTMLAYIQDSEGTVVGILSGSGVMELLDKDTIHSIDEWALFAPYQDPFGDDLPAYGYFGPIERTGKRVPRRDVR